MRRLLLLLVLPIAAWAQNPNPCRSVSNSATTGQVLSANGNGTAPVCKWITGGGGGGGVSQVNTTAPILGGPITTTGTITCRTATGSVSGCLSAADWNTFNGKLSAITVGSTPVNGGTTTSVLFNNLGVLGNYAVVGSGGVCMTTNCSLTNANLNTPSAIDLTNATNLPCAALPALTTDVITSAGSCATTIANDAVTTAKILNANVTAAKMVNAGVFTGDVTTTFPAITVAKVNGISYSSTGAAHSVPVITTANTTATYKAIPDCTDTGGNHLNFTQSTDTFSCGTSGGSSGITIGTTTITSGTNTRVLFDNAGVVGEYTISGSGNVCMTTSCTMTTPVLGTPTSGTLTNATGLPCASGIIGNYGCLVEQHTVSGSTTQAFTTCISATYDDYVVEFVGLTMTTNTASLFLQVSTDGGMSYASTGYISMLAGWTLDTAVGGTGTTTSGIYLVNTYGTGITRGIIGGHVKMFKPAESTNDKVFTGQIVAPISDGHWYNLQLGGVYNSATAVNAFQIATSSGNFSGILRCYGMAK